MKKMIVLCSLFSMIFTFAIGFNFPGDMVATSEFKEIIVVYGPGETS